MPLIHRILAFLSNVFLIPQEEADFTELYIDKGEHYRESIPDWVLDGAYVALSYDEDIRHEIAAFKYSGRREKHTVFAPYLVRCTELFVAEQIDPDAIVVSAPLFFLSRLRRGYNQSRLLAEDVAKASGLRYLDVLRKTRWTRHQARLDRASRLTNLADAFSVRKKYLSRIREKDVILVDDIISTGSTANECAKALKKAGARRVFGVFVATGD